MKKIVLLLMLSLSQEVFSQSAVNQAITVTTDSQDALYAKTKMWIARYFVANYFPVLQSSGQMPVVITEDRITGSIAVAGMVRYEGVPGQPFFDEYLNALFFFQIKESSTKMTLVRVFKHIAGSVDYEYTGKEFEKVLPKIKPAMDDYQKFVQTYSLDF